MADNRGNDNDLKTNNDVIDDSEEENEILEESPCGRWLKRREEVEQRDIPGIDATYLAMDTEEGVEVVWNEVQFSERKYFKTKEETISEVFDRLIQLEHPNIVKLHKYWVHKDVEKPRVIFITEYMSSGSLKQFLRKTKRSLIKMSLNAWRRWCTQTLSALCYLHTSQPPIIHGNLNCDTIFISHNGLIKIGAVAPDAIHKHVKTVRGDSKANLHFVAPEIGCIHDTDSSDLAPSVDIYSFGMCALEMAALEISANGETTHITDDVISTTIEGLDNRLQKDFITRCLSKDSKQRPTARELLFHPIIFEVPSLRLFAAHIIVNTPSYQPTEQLTEEVISRVLCLQNGNDRVLAEIIHNESRPNVALKQSDSPKVEFEKFFEEVRNGAFPLTAIVTTTRPPLISRQRTMSPEVSGVSGESTKQLNSPEIPWEEETRRIITINSTLEPTSDNSSDKRLVISIHIVFEDKINRKLSTKLEFSELIPMSLTQELVYYGLVHKEDQGIVCDILSETKNLFSNSGNQSISCQKSQQMTKPSEVVTKPSEVVNPKPVGIPQHTQTPQPKQPIPQIIQQPIPTSQTQQSLQQPLQPTPISQSQPVVQQPQQPMPTQQQQQVHQTVQQSVPQQKQQSTQYPNPQQMVNPPNPQPIQQNRQQTAAQNQTQQSKPDLIQQNPQQVQQKPQPISQSVSQPQQVIQQPQQVVQQPQQVVQQPQQPMPTPQTQQQQPVHQTTQQSVPQQKQQSTQYQNPQQMVNPPNPQPITNHPNPQPITNHPNPQPITNHPNPQPITNHPNPQQVQQNRQQTAAQNQTQQSKPDLIQQNPQQIQQNPQQIQQNPQQIQQKLQPIQPISQSVSQPQQSVQQSTQTAQPNPQTDKKGSVV